ncbi:hypothetical protein H6P81_015404 [Aristolochia fimbriata]|uniref:Uncharacterized protein n=1 Tax=Aristolochia fimbriata TaxID=158543 RepID=A0AAV7E5M1_ARIFI|nr:hypothetical protein H6P81_015404 [Aristolochia fimbriata]
MAIINVRLSFSVQSDVAASGLRPPYLATHCHHDGEREKQLVSVPKKNSSCLKWSTTNDFACSALRTSYWKEWRHCKYSKNLCQRRFKESNRKIDVAGTTSDMFP